MKRIFYAVILCLITHISFARQFSRWESEEGLYLEFYRGNKLVGSATGFVIKSNTQNYLVANYHAVTNKPWVQLKPMFRKDSLLNGKWGNAPKDQVPTMVAIYHNATEAGKHLVKYENLYGIKGKKLWHEFRLINGYVDAVALPLKDTAGIEIFPVDYSGDTKFSLAYPVGMINYPKDSKAGVTDMAKDSGKIYLSEMAYHTMSGSPVYVVINNDPHFVGIFSQSPTVRTNIVNGGFLEKKFMKLP